MKILQPIIKWTGSKRSQVTAIQTRIPQRFGDYYEPFVGSAAVVANLNIEKTKRVCGDIMEPLIKIFHIIQSENRKDLLFHYAKEWALTQHEPNHYYVVRERFNQEHDPKDFFYLCRNSHNGLVRFNSKGEFNAPIMLRKNSNYGIEPHRLRVIIENYHHRLADVTFVPGNYRETTQDAKAGDFVYCDPPYASDYPIYGYNNFDFNDFVKWLAELNEKGILWMCSYNGKGDPELDKISSDHFGVVSGPSSFRKFNREGDVVVTESLYTNYKMPIIEEALL